MIINTTDIIPSRKNRLYPEIAGMDGMLFITVMLSVPRFPALSSA
jgi:hypothetical protein